MDEAAVGSHEETQEGPYRLVMKNARKPSCQVELGYSLCCLHNRPVFIQSAQMFQPMIRITAADRAREADCIWQAPVRFSVSLQNWALRGTVATLLTRPGFIY
jgi:hypothetical protein